VALVVSNGAGNEHAFTARSPACCGHRPPHLFFVARTSQATAASHHDLVLLHAPEGRRLFPRRQNVTPPQSSASMAARLDGPSSGQRYDRLRALSHAGRAPQRMAGCCGWPAADAGDRQALMRQPKLLMLDEPSLGLAPIASIRWWKCCNGCVRLAPPSCWSSRCRARSSDIADHALVLPERRVIGSGTS